MRRLGLFALLLVSVPALAKPVELKPRPLSDAERAAVTSAIHYLAGGSEALWNDLATTSPLRRAGRAAAVLEIRARCGPVKDSKWSLETVVPSLKDRMAVFSVQFPSGADDTVTFEMVSEASAWKVASIHTSAEPVRREELLPKQAPSSRITETLIDQRVALAFGLPATLLALAGTALVRRRAVGRLLLVLSTFALLGATVAIVEPRIHMGAAESGSGTNALHAGSDAMVPLGGLVALREGLASGDERVVGTAARLQPGPTRDVASLWEAEILLSHDHAREAKHILDAFPHYSNAALLEVLRGRLAYAESRAEDVVLAYERAITIGPGHDRLWLEAAELMSILGFDDRSAGYFRRMTMIGSRAPAVFYVAANQAVLDDDSYGARNYLLTAWHLRPVERDEIVGMPMLWQVLRDKQVAAELQFGVANEPSFATAVTAPLDVPAGTAADVSGDFLRLRISGAELFVSGGAAFAPAPVRVLDAATWRREEESAALARLDEVRRDATPVAMTQPVTRDQCLLTADALAARNRWADVLTLTSALPANDERVPLMLSLARGRALAKLGRAPELKRLVVDLLSNPSMKRKKDPAAMRMTAELLADIDEYDAAIRLLERVKSQMDLPGIDHRIDQLAVEKKLSQNYAILSTAHLDIHYPQDPIYQTSMKRLSEILESEFQRLHAQWFSKASGQRVNVNILFWRDFRDYSGSDYIAGLYTNKVFLPLAGVDQFPPEIVALGTHELAHALIADATHNFAPRWFHEALASRVEMKENEENAFRKYDAGQILSVNVLDGVADGSPDPELVGETYSVGESTLRFIEARWGKGGIARMLDAFATGADTGQALQNVTGMTVGALDTAARQWGSTQPVVFAAEPIVRYDVADAEKENGVALKRHKR
jgi:hypothetical protein